MLITHIKFFVRVFLKDKFFSLLNILGLALGIGVGIVLLLILQHDLTFDKHFANYQQIYRLGGHLKATGIDIRVARSARELAQILKSELPEVQEATRANNWDHTLIKRDKKGVEVAYYEEDVVRTDSTYFHVFKHRFIAGDEKTCLNLLNSIVITESTAKRYFGNEDPLNQELSIDGQQWKVTAVIKDLPKNTHLKFDFLLSGLSKSREWAIDKGEIKSEAFWNPDVYTYLVMPAHYEPKAFESKFVAIFNKYYKSFGDQVGGQYTPVLQPLGDIHFHSDLQADEPVGNLSYLYAFTGIGIFIILLACINYMNLSTAKSMKRAAEIAMKKTLGSGKRSLVLSFLGESVFLSFISLVFAIVLVLLVLKATSFNSLIGKDLSPDFIHNPLLLFGSFAVAIAIGVLSGLYPAFYLPSVPTLSALKGDFKNRASSHVLRRLLITTQFTISIFVVVCTFFMSDQINFVRNIDLGFSKDNVLILPVQDTLVQNQLASIKNEFLRNPRITAATTSYNVPGMGVGGPVMWAEGEGGMKQQAFKLMVVAEDFFKTMNIELMKGRGFQPGAKVDTENTFICNQAAAKLMGWGDDPVGKKVKWFHGKEDGRVIGMVKDFNYHSLHNAIEPLLIIKSGKEGGFLYLKVAGDHLPETMNYIREKWIGYDPNHPFEYFFLDQRFNEQYKSDETQYQLLSGLSSICIFVSLLGLLGLSAFTAAQRTKEIGIRKVHGASVPHIIYLLFKDIMFLVMIAAVLVIPAALYVIQQWLGNFAYKNELNYFTFALVAILALLFAFVTVAFHSLKTARTNPVVSLKYE
ncbi:MAG TPA: ABC transporter permease [Cyclobacteriaceae bacterium]|nr:ABC transporter permease [Cyclobacteriaceae bacterium]